MNLSSKILVTGANGFLGRHVMRKLHERGYSHVVGPRRDECDLTDFRQTQELFKRMMPDAVIHLAARVGGIGANRRSPGDFFLDNILMGVHAIECAREHDVQKFILISTVCSYPERTPTPFSESSIWNGYPEPTNAPYGIAKKSLSVMLDAYREQFDFDGTTLIPTNLYGPGDHDDLEASHVIPALIRKMLEAVGTEGPVEVWGTGRATRDFLYVEDCADAIAASLDCPYPGPINLGSGFDISIRELAFRIAQECCVSADRILFDSSKPDGQMVRRLDSSYAKMALGWEATTPFDVGLLKTIDSIRKNP